MYKETTYKSKKFFQIPIFLSTIFEVYWLCIFTPNPLSLEMTSILCDFVSRITHMLSQANLSFSHLKLQPQQTIGLFPKFGERDSCSFCQLNKAFYISDTIYREPLLKNEIPRPQLKTIDLGFLEMELWYLYFIKLHTWFLGTLSFENCRAAPLLKQASSSLGNNQGSYRVVTLL